MQLQSANLLFVDNPVGTGFSYVSKDGEYAKDLATVASDMMVLLQSFFSCRPEFQVSRASGTAEQGVIGSDTVPTRTNFSQHSARLIHFHAPDPVVGFGFSLHSRWFLA